jgi:hypothetical protein
MSCPAIFDDLITSISEMVQGALNNTESINQMIGTIQLCECVLLGLDANRLDQAFEKINSKLKFIADKYYEFFRNSQAELLA